jgi:hypothetical protein
MDAWSDDAAPDAAGTPDVWAQASAHPSSNNKYAARLAGFADIMRSIPSSCFEGIPIMIQDTPGS